MERISPQDLYQLRSLLHRAEGKRLEAQEALRTARAFLLELEHQYGLLGAEAALNLDNGRIERKEAVHGPGHHADTGAP